MTTDHSTLVTRYAIAFLFIGLAVGATFLVRSQIPMPPSPLLLVGILGAAWFGGRIPGLIAVLVADFTYDFFFDGNPAQFENPAAHVLRLLVFAAIALITASRRKTELALSLRELQQAAVVKLGQEALSGAPFDTLVTHAAEVIKETLRADQTAICEIVAVSNKYRFIAGTGWNEPILGKELDLEAGYSLVGRVLESDGPVVISDLSSKSHIRPSIVLQNHGVRSMVGVKIDGADDVFGIVGAFRTKPKAFTNDDANFLGSVANIIAETAARSRAEAKGDEHRVWLQTTLSSIGDGVIATDADGNVNFMNAVAARLTGWDEESARGRSLREVFNIVNEDTRQVVVNPVESVMKTGAVVGLANHTVLISRSGEEFPISDSAAPIRNGSEIRGVVLVFSDVSERKRAERFKERRAKEIAALYEFTHRLSRAGSMDDVYEAALDSITLSLNCDRSSVLLFDDEGVMQFVASRGLSDAYRQRAAGHSPWAFGEKGARPLGVESVDDSDIEEPLLSSIKAEGIEALGFIPLISEERLIGKVMVYYNAPHSFTDAEFEIAMTVANQIASGLEQKKAETRLLENEERLRLATQTGKVGVWDWDVKNGKISWTDAVFEMHGVNKGEFDGSMESYAALIHPSDRAFVTERIEKALAGEMPYDIEFRTIRPDGSTGWLFTNGRVFRDGGTPTRMIGATTDITARKKAEEATARLAAVVSSSQDAIISMDLNGVITSWNRGAELLFGYTAAEAVDKPVTILIPKDRINEEPAILERIRRGEPVDHFDTVRRHKNGTLLDISLTVSPVKDGTGNIIGASKIARDITERKRAEATAARLVAIINSSHDAIISKDLNGHITSWNKGAEMLFGYQPDEIIGKPVTVLMPDDRVDEEFGILERIRKGEAIEPYETVRQRKDGSSVEISLSISPIRDKDGKIIGASKIARDITERKAAESARRDSEIMQSIVEAQESERHRIARDLHDHLGQQMTAMRFQIEAMTEKCAADPVLRKAIEAIQNSALQIDRDIGFLSWELRPTELDHLGLEDALASFVREWSDQYGIAAKFHASLPESANGGTRLPKDIETNLYRIVQEGLNNILKHANAENVNVLLLQQKGQIVLVIEDDGSGIDRNPHEDGRIKPAGLGLVGMSERAALLRGTLEIESQAGAGTTILVRVPFRVG